MAVQWLGWQPDYAGERRARTLQQLMSAAQLIASQKEAEAGRTFAAGEAEKDRLLREKLASMEIAGRESVASMKGTNGPMDPSDLKTLLDLVKNVPGIEPLLGQMGYNLPKLPEIPADETTEEKAAAQVRGEYGAKQGLGLPISPMDIAAQTAQGNIAGQVAGKTAANLPISPMDEAIQSSRGGVIGAAIGREEAGLPDPYEVQRMLTDRMMLMNQMNAILANPKSTEAMKQAAQDMLEENSRESKKLIKMLKEKFETPAAGTTLSPASALAPAKSDDPSQYW